MSSLVIAIASRLTVKKHFELSYFQGNFSFIASAFCRNFNVVLCHHGSEILHHSFLVRTVICLPYCPCTLIRLYLLSYVTFHISKWSGHERQIPTKFSICGCATVELNQILVNSGDKSPLLFVPSP